MSSDAAVAHTTTEFDAPWGAGEGLHAAALLPAIEAQAEQADQTRSLDPGVVAEIKKGDLLALSATREISGLEGSVLHIAKELEAVASACGSTGWCLWNHFCVFHLYCGALGPSQRDLLASIVEAREWVCFPAGAGTRVLGTLDGDRIRLNGSAQFGSGARYGEWIGVAFGVDRGDGQVGDPPDIRFTIVRRDDPGVRVDPTWDGMGLRASATDHVHYEDATVPADRWSPWFGARADQFRRDDYAVIHPRYREDWVGLSDLWLGAQAAGLVRAALRDTCAEVRHRRAILGAKMVERASIHLNLGRAAWLLRAARASVETGCREVDERVEAGRAPTQSDYLAQMGHCTAALSACDEAMRLILRVLGGNGLRESGHFERRYRDFQAMPLHINAHQDRVSEQLGRHILGIPLEMF